MSLPFASCCLVLLLLIMLPAQAADYRIDPARSHADFGVKLFWLSQINGRFEEIDGDVTLSSLHDTAVVDARITQRLDYPEYVLDVDRTKAAELGLNFCA